MQWKQPDVSDVKWRSPSTTKPAKPATKAPAGIPTENWGRVHGR